MKKSVIIIAVIAIGSLLGFQYFGRPAYKRHKEARSIQQAKSFMANHDYRNASLSARQAWQLNPKNLEACRIMEEIAEMSPFPAVLLDWRRRIADLAPTAENKIRLASTALRAQGAPYPLTAQILEEIGGSAKDVAAYHVVAAELALKLNKVSEAAEQFEQASRLEPTNQLHQLNLAVLRLSSTNASQASAAWATLESLRTSTNIGAFALRWLVTESVRRNDLAGAFRFSQQLMDHPHCVLDDRLQHLSILQKAKNPEFDPYLNTMRESANTNAVDIRAISVWMIGHGLVDEAMNWLSQRPAPVRAEQPVRLAFVEGYLAKQDWGSLEAFLGDQKWGDMEYLRSAFLARAAWEQKQDLAADARWRTAVREAGDRLGSMTTLVGLADRWRREKAKEVLLWQISQRFPKERWALRELGRFYMATANTRGLNKVYSAMANFEAKDFVYRHNLAATSLLLKINLPNAHELAKELYAKHPEEPIITSTYAYSLHLQGRTREGLAALEKLNTESIEKPQVALYYGVLLSAIGETNKARKYLELAQHADVLPEEKALLAAALKAP